MGADNFEPTIYYGVYIDLSDLPKLIKLKDKLPYRVEMIETYTHSRSEEEQTYEFLHRCMGFIGFQIKQYDNPQQVSDNSLIFRNFLKECELLKEFNISYSPSFICGQVKGTEIYNYFKQEQYYKYVENICWNCDESLNDSEEEYYFNGEEWSMNCSYCKD